LAQIKVFVKEITIINQQDAPQQGFKPYNAVRSWI